MRVLFAAWNRVLLSGAVVFVVLSVVCALALFARAEPLQGVHPALKPFKFAISIALFLGTFSFLLPRLSVEPVTIDALAWLLVATMTLEMIPIGGQALRGTTSHFNVDGALNTFVTGAPR
jgi:hypothetical protein